MKNRLFGLLCLMMLVTSIGCGQSQSSRTVEPITISPAEQIKNALQGTVTAGTLGSEIVTVEENLPKLDAAKAAEIKADVEELKGLQGSQAVAKAKAIIAKL